jgi:hypothetical protein
MKAILNIFAVLCVLSFAVACSDDEKPAAEASSGGEDENAFDTAERNVNEAQQDFQEEIKPAAEFVDEKANKAAEEGRKAAGKVGDAISGEDDDEEPEPGKP